MCRMLVGSDLKSLLYGHSVSHGSAIPIGRKPISADLPGCRIVKFCNSTTSGDFNRFCPKGEVGKVVRVQALADIPSLVEYPVILAPINAGLTLAVSSIIHPPARRDGLVHEYWKHKIAAELKAKGFDVKVEAGLETGGTVDILVQTEDGPRAVEIETGKSDVKANIEKCEKADIPMTVVATDRDVEKKLSGLLATEVKVLCALEPDLIGILPT